MALIKLGALLTNISGKVGGQSFATGKGGAYLKNIGAQINPGTSKQLAIRSQTATISALWRTLTPLQAQTFKDQVKDYPYVNRVGDSKEYSAFNLFQKLNQGKAMIGESFLTSLGAKVTEINPIIEFDDLTKNVMFIVASGTGNNHKYVVKATPSLSQGISNAHAYFKTVGVFTSAQLLATIDIMPQYLSVFATPTPAQKIFISLTPVAISTGYQNGPVSVASGTVT